MAATDTPRRQRAPSYSERIELAEHEALVAATIASDLGNGAPSTPQVRTRLFDAARRLYALGRGFHAR